MKLTTIIVIVTLLHVSAASTAQNVTYSNKKAPLEQIFKVIRQQTGYNVLWSTDNIKNVPAQAINFKNASIQEVLDRVLQGQPLTYSIKDRSVLIKLKEPSVAATVDGGVKQGNTGAKPVNISGGVTDTTGAPLVSASVALQGTSFATRTDNRGQFRFTNVPQGSYVLVVSYIGYAKLERRIKVDGDQDLNEDVRLSTSTSALDQVQIIAYGSESKRFSVGSVASITANDIARQPVTNPLLALQGQVPGLVVNSTSGVPGAQVQVQVRGQNTLSGINENLKPYDQPLFVIDGVPFAPQNNNVSQLNSLASTQSVGGILNQATGGISPFNNINPNDIESISILKDADATSIYGTQGSNGVIIITTKKGKPGKTRLNLSLATGFNSDARPTQFLNTQQYLQFRKDAFAADGLTPSTDPNDPGYAPDILIFDNKKYTDWQKVIDGKTSNNTDIHASLSGGTANNTFLISTGYTRSDYNFPGDFADQRLTLHSVLHHVSENNRFTLDFINDYGYDHNNSSAFGGTQGILLPPNTPDLLDSQGNLVWNYQGVDLSGLQFYSYLKQSTDLENYNLNNSLQIGYKIIGGLAFHLNLGYNRNTTSETQELPSSAQDPAFGGTSQSIFSNTIAQTINVEPQINYDATIGNGMLSALVGGSYKKNSGDQRTLNGSGYSNDNLLGSINGAASIYAFDNPNIYKYSAGFARLKYIYAQKYIISLTGRRDGSSNFGPGRQFGNFGSAGLGWIFSEENGFKKSLPFISYGKLSGSYGTSGSDGIQAYQYQAFWRSAGGVAFEGTQPSVPQNLYNPNYSWALKKSLNVAVDLGFLDNRILLNATYYRDREGNELAGYPLPIQTGFQSVLENLNAIIQNQGYEFSASSTNIKGKNFTWTTNFNITFNRNKLLAFPNLESSSYANQYVIGQPTSIIFGYKYKGVNPTTGLFEFYDKNGNPTSNPQYGLTSAGGDQVPIANLEVKYTGGFGNNFTYKNWGLFIFCQFASQMAPNYLAYAYSLNPPGSSLGNVPTVIYNNYWKNPGDNAQLQRLSSSFFSNSFATAQDFGQSSAVYSNDTYLRVKTISLSYTLPAALVKKLHIADAKVYVNAQNVFTITNFKVGDPESFDYTSIPPQRIIAFGLNLNF